MIPVLFRSDPAVPRELTAAGIGIERQLPEDSAIRVQLIGGPFIDAFYEGLHELEVKP